MVGCEFSSKDDSIIVSGEFPIIYVKRPQTVIVNPTDSISPTANSDLFFRDVASPESAERNLTHELTLGKGDVSDPEVSFDGKQIIFSMKCSGQSSAACNSDTTWNIWIYDIDNKTFRKAITAFEKANLADDIDPAFLPNDKIIFSSTRQLSILEKHEYVFTDELQRVPVSVLHTLDLNTQTIEQISFNRGLDRNPTVLRNGKIIFSRWQFEEGHRKFAIYSANPDGSEMNVLYGAHSPGDAFLHPRELPDGKIISTVLPIEGTWESGALMTLDVANYTNANDPGPFVSEKSVSGQQFSTIQEIPLHKSVSNLGRFTTPYPLLDGSDQVLVSFSFLQELQGNESVLDQINSVEDLEAPPSFGIYILNTSDKSLKPLVLAQPNLSLTDPIAVFPREVPASRLRNAPINPGVFNESQVQGILNILSVYDTDQFGRMGQGVLTPHENSLTPFPLIEPLNPAQDPRQFVADIATLKDPMITGADQRPARFVRVTQALPIPVEFKAQTLGEGVEFIMQKIIGYAPVEPDGSVKIKVPADVPISISVLDRYGRAYENHSNWIQVRPGETLTCNGCHASQNFKPINSAPIAGFHPNTALRFSSGLPAGVAAAEGETMAETRTGVDEVALELTKDVIFTDVWTDQSRRSIDSSINYLYSNIPTPTPNDGIIDYPTHIQPLWDEPRPINGERLSCADCHDNVRDVNTNPTSLDLTGISSNGRTPSYRSLMVGSVLTDELGSPLFEQFGDAEVPRRASPLVNAGYARGSYLIEKLYNSELFADKALPANGLDHSSMLNNDEKRLVVEWIDIGAQYFNDPFDENGILREIKPKTGLAEFAPVEAGLVQKCGSCHVAKTLGGLDNLGWVNTGFTLGRGAAALEGNFEVAYRMANNQADPDKSYLLARPSGATPGDDSHWLNPAQTIPVLTVDDELYIAIKAWIESL